MTPSTNPRFTAYARRQEGDSFRAPIHLFGPEAVWRYAAFQGAISHEVRITDDDDFIVLQVVGGELCFPTTKEGVPQPWIDDFNRKLQDRIERIKSPAPIEVKS